MIPLDKFSRSYADLLHMQQNQLNQWGRVLRTEAFAALATHCRLVNRPVDVRELALIQSSKSYKAGGLHNCPVGAELCDLVAAWGTPKQFELFVTPTRALQTSVVNQLNMNQKLLEQIQALISAMLALTAALTKAAATPAAEDDDVPEVKPKPKAKPAAEDEDDAVEVKSKKKPAPAAEDDDVPEVKPKPKAKPAAEDEDEGDVTLESLRALAKQVIKAGHSSRLEKLLSKFETESLTDMDKSHYPAAHAKLTAILADE